MNVSRRDLYALDVLGTFEGLLEKYDIPPRLLAVEITESAYVEDCELIVDIVEGFHDLGISVHMDDFGSGYSSLNVLKDVDIDTMKLDRAFFSAGDDAGQREWDVVESVVDLAKKLDLGTVAEGVEEPGQAARLRAINCDMLQGYVFSRPVPVAEFEQMLFGE